MLFIRWKVLLLPKKHRPRSWKGFFCSRSTAHGRGKYFFCSRSTAHGRGKYFFCSRSTVHGRESASCYLLKEITDDVVAIRVKQQGQKEGHADHLRSFEEFVARFATRHDFVEQEHDVPTV